MKTTDLRIGNRTNNGVVIGIADGYIECAGNYNITGRTSFRDADLEPEPLTEEWLKKFGFEYEPGSIDVWWVGSFGIDAAGKSYHYTCGEYIHGIGIKHVHQLQNLYFALTGEELILK